jgi:hypothetical protein
MSLYQGSTMAGKQTKYSFTLANQLLLSFYNQLYNHANMLSLTSETYVELDYKENIIIRYATKMS